MMFFFCFQHIKVLLAVLNWNKSLFMLAQSTKAWEAYFTLAGDTRVFYHVALGQQFRCWCPITVTRGENSVAVSVKNQ